MKLRELDSLDRVESIMAIEEIFVVHIPDMNAEGFEGPRDIVDWLELQLSNERLNDRAKDALRGIAKATQNPSLVEDLNGTWRREQIAAIIREIYREA